MKVYLVEYSRFNSWGEYKECHVDWIFKDRKSAISYMIAKARQYYGANYHVVLVNSGLYVDTMRSEKSNTKFMEEEIVEIRVIEREVK